jgi:hypothetical protein
MSDKWLQTVCRARRFSANSSQDMVYEKLAMMMLPRAGHRAVCGLANLTAQSWEVL